MNKIPIKDIVIILPGILGSVLQKDGKDLWAVSKQSIWNALTNKTQALADLTLDEDSAGDIDLEDGIRATRIMSDSQLIPGLVKVDGYSRTNRFITDNFDVTFGDLFNDPDDKAANFYHFPYDWRRDCRANARILKRAIDKRLDCWRKSSGAADAKVIFLAHSMGGLVARYYLEVLGGWVDARSLVTFGTPYRGAFDAVNFLANGYKKLFLDLTEAVRSFTSIYQLLPIYPALKADGKYHRVAEIAGLPNIDQQRAQAALQFHREIETAVAKNQTNEQYLTQFKTLPIVGVSQLTMQSAELSNGTVSVSRDLPDLLKNQPALGDGDGTVPQVSAIPIEHSQTVNNLFIAETHGALQYQQQVLQDLLKKLVTAQFDISQVRKPQAAIGLSVDDLFLPDEPVVLQAQVSATHPIEGLMAHIEPVTAKGAPIAVPLTQQDRRWSLELDTPPAGLYRVTVQEKANLISSVHSLFEVVGQEA